jgi:hypothetical protein
MWWQTGQRGEVTWGRRETRRGDAVESSSTSQEKEEQAQTYESCDDEVGWSDDEKEREERKGKSNNDQDERLVVHPLLHLILSSSHPTSHLTITPILPLHDAVMMQSSSSSTTWCSRVGFRSPLLPVHATRSSLITHSDASSLPQHRLKPNTRGTSTRLFSSCFDYPSLPLLPIVIIVMHWR